MADYVFYRTFDVQSYTITEKIDDKIAGVEAQYLLNRKDQQSNSISKFEEKGGSGKPGLSISIPSISKLDSLRTLENKVDGKTEQAPTSSKRDDVVANELSERRCPLDDKIHSKSTNSFTKDREDATISSANHVDVNRSYSKGESHSGLVDNESSKKMGLVDTPVDALYDSSLRKRKIESNGGGKESPEKRNDTVVDNEPPKKKFVGAPTEPLNDASSKKQKVESNVNGSPKEIVCLPKESSKKNDAIVDKRYPKKMKIIDASSEALNDASSRKEKLATKGDDSLKETVRRKEFSEKRNLVDKETKPFNESLQEATPVSIANKIKAEYEVLDVTRRPDADRSKWFKGLPWEERMQKADEQGTLVLIENLDPLYTSSEVEDIIYHTLKQSCTARVIPQATVQNPNYGQAYVIFKTRDAADLAVSKINRGCIQLPNGSPLLCSQGMLKVPKSSMCGHLSVEKNRLQMREMKRALSTSHCSQPNTIEYEMAMDWLFIQERSVRCFKALHKGQADELKETKRRLKTK